MNIIETALHYKNDLGLSVVPQKLKQSLVKWTDYQINKPTDDDIKKWWSKTPDAGIAAVVGSVSGVIVIDCDSQDAINEMESLFPDNLIIPCTETPRGGRHYYFAASDKIQKQVNWKNKIDLQAEKSMIVMPPSIGENGKPYKWIIEPKSKNDFPPPPASFQASINNNKKNNYTHDVILTSVRNELTSPYNSYTILQKGTRDDDLFHVANWLLKGGRGEAYVRQVLEILAKSCKPPFSEKELNDKISSALKRQNERKGNLASEIKEWCFLQDGYFSITDVCQTLQIITKEDKNNTHVTLKRLCDSGIIEKYGEKRGQYRLRKNDTQEMDLKTEPVITDVRVKLPCQLNDMCVLSPGNITVVAGSKSAGKTAFMLNIAAFNQSEFEIIFLNSEMSETEFKKRMKKIMPLNDWNIKAYKCHNNFDDYIESNPKKIYIVDFLEVHDNFFEIAKPIRKIHEKLGESLCFIAIHMKLGNSLGRGGDFSAEKARLYLTMDYVAGEKKSKITIYDAKEPRPPHESVRGMWRMVKIINGSQLTYSPQDNWKY
jgi:hypothetical protein